MQSGLLENEVRPGVLRFSFKQDFKQRCVLQLLRHNAYGTGGRLILFRVFGILAGRTFVECWTDFRSSVAFKILNASFSNIILITVLEAPGSRFCLLNKIIKTLIESFHWGHENTEYFIRRDLPFSNFCKRNCHSS